MERTYIRDVAAKAEQEVLVRGFTENFRDGKSMAFLVIKDITGKVQVTIEKELHPEWADTLAQITQDTVVSVTGIVKLSEFVKLNGIEIIPTSISIDSVAAPLPIARDYIPATKKKAAGGALLHRPAHRLPLDRPPHGCQPADVQGTDRFSARPSRFRPGPRLHRGTHPETDRRGFRVRCGRVPS